MTSGRRTPAALAEADELLHEVEDFLEQAGMSARALGVLANDPNLVFQLRKGRCPGKPVRLRLRAVMAANPGYTRRPRFPPPADGCWVRREGSRVELRVNGERAFLRPEVAHALAHRLADAAGQLA